MCTIISSCVVQDPGGQEPIDIVVTNETAFEAHLIVALDGEEIQINVAEFQVAEQGTASCPGVLKLIRQTLDPNGAATTTEFDEAQGLLLLGENFACGDRILINVSIDATTIGSEPAP
jgi:hypothetical protein